MGSVNGRAFLAGVAVGVTLTAGWLPVALARADEKARHWLGLRRVRRLERVAGFTLEPWQRDYVLSILAAHDA